MRPTSRAYWSNVRSLQCLLCPVADGNSVQKLPCQELGRKEGSSSSLVFLPFRYPNAMFLVGRTTSADSQGRFAGISIYLSRQGKAMLHCDLRVRWKVASDLRFRAAISEPKTPSFCGISGDLAPSTRKSLAIAIVRFWCAKLRARFRRTIFISS